MYTSESSSKRLTVGSVISLEGKGVAMTVFFNL